MRGAERARKRSQQGAPFFFRQRTTTPKRPLGAAAPPPAVALPPSPPSGPALQLVPSPPSESVSVTQRRCEAEEPSGGAAAASSSCTSRAARSDLPRALRERITKRTPRLSLRPRLLQLLALRPTSSRRARPAGEEGCGGTLGCLLVLLAHAPFTPLAPGLGAVLGFRAPAIVR